MQGYKLSNYEYMTLTELMSENSFLGISERELSKKTPKERDTILMVRDILEDLITVFNLFGSPTSIHMKFANLSLYTIKRFNTLYYNMDDYNPLGGSSDMKY